MRKARGLLMAFFFFWMFTLLFKFGAGLHYTMLSPLGEGLMPLWLIGLIMGAASIFQLVFDIPAGAILDRFGYRKMLAIGTAVGIIASGMLFFGLTKTTLIISIFLMAFAWLFFGPGVNAYSLSHATRNNAERFMAYRDISASIGIVAASFILAFVVNSGIKTISIILSALLVLSLAAVMLSPKDTRRIKLKDNPHERTHLQRNHALRNLLKTFKSLNPASSLLLMFSLAGSTFYGIVWFVVPLVIAANPSAFQILGIGLGMFDFAVIITGTLMYSIVEKTEKKRLIFIGMLLFSIAGMFVGLHFGLLFLLFAFLTTMGDELASLPLWAWLHQLDKDHNKDGVISGTINVFEDLGWAIGPVIGGLLYVWIGPNLSIALGALPLLMLLLIYQFVVRKHIIKIKLLDAPRRPHKHRHKH